MTCLDIPERLDFRNANERIPEDSEHHRAGVDLHHHCTRDERRPAFFQVTELVAEFGNPGCTVFLPRRAISAALTAWRRTIARPGIDERGTGSLSTQLFSEYSVPQVWIPIPLP